ncbi:hypothetical protein [Plebeiibacterium sediminum]|uniref:Uncharacterized protein n=1 Tax=Plebeiibacterium sediminum TaxID=2992112 RepID=A0AAE3SED8_9BACT|nr:hypothetical protein [Plebeiobacterium sediminum]MCW3786300.1 hypothetical protein [Plebeiobacterium sediminum]
MINLKTTYNPNLKTSLQLCKKGFLFRNIALQVRDKLSTLWKTSRLHAASFPHSGKGADYTRQAFHALEKLPITGGKLSRVWNGCRLQAARFPENLKQWIQPFF